MKFAKGLLTDDEQKKALEEREVAVASPRAAVDARVSGPVVVDKNRLFQTVEESKGSSRKYIGVLGVVAVLVAVGGAVVWYLNRPGVGSNIRVSAETELALRDHFLIKEKRTATDISFFQCDGFIWARVGVETRTDMPNPLLRIPIYKARLMPSGDATVITAAPITSPAEDQPCA